ncbi:MAG: transglycosylase SLT domain-containing protein [Mariprofundaceae bacterium]
MTIFLNSCASSPPQKLGNSCDIFREKSDWYDATQDSFEKWGVPIHVQLAIIHQESRFRGEARPPKETLLWVIPWGYKSSAYGFAQVKDATWKWYQEKSGNDGADRDDFDDATDFIGWYGAMTQRLLGVSKWDTYNQYLAYHEGHGGFRRKTYNSKPWLISVARKVEARAAQYRTQLASCKDELEGWGLWPF